MNRGAHPFLCSGDVVLGQGKGFLKDSNECGQAVSFNVGEAFCFALRDNDAGDTPRP